SSAAEGTDAAGPASRVATSRLRRSTRAVGARLAAQSRSTGDLLLRGRPRVPPPADGPWQRRRSIARRGALHRRQPPQAGDRLHAAPLGDAGRAGAGRGPPRLAHADRPSPPGAARAGDRPGAAPDAGADAGGLIAVARQVRSERAAGAVPRPS